MYSTYSDDQNWVISDVRFLNEAESIRKRGGILIRLEGDPTGIRAKDTRDPNHESEIQLDDYEHFDNKLGTYKRRTTIIVRPAVSFYNVSFVSFSLEVRH